MGALSNRRAPHEDKDDLREHVLRASVELIDEQGLGALSMREVARRAGVSHQAPYHYFADREAILAAVAERGFALLAEAIGKARADATGPTDALERAAVAYLSFALANPAYFRIMFRPELVKLSNHHDLDCTADQAFCHVPAMVAACVEAGLPRDIGEDTMAAFLWSVVHGLAHLIIDGPLLEKVPSFIHDRDGAIRDVAHTVRRMIDAVMAPPRAPAPRTPASRASAGRSQASKRRPSNKRAR
jgi:AcrR family transcriptional regulator